MSSIREELLLKAKRDVSKLVKVQRVVSRGGKTFTQNFYVQPNQVKSTDKVVGGQNNLNNFLNPQVVPTPPKGVLDSAYFDYIKLDKSKALDYLKSCGIQWKECTTSAAINWMRATQAYQAALNGQNGTNSNNSINTQTTNNNQQNGQISQPNSYTTVKLTSTQQDEVNTGANGREKVVILKKLLGKDGCINYAKTLGVTWEEHTHGAINNMRMSMALTEYFDNLDGTTSPVKVKGDKGGAPKGNKNAQKDSTKVDKAKLTVPKNATDRQKNIIDLINNITDEEDLKMYTSVGIIAEDDVSKSFIKNKLAPKFKAWNEEHGKKKSSSSKGNKTYSNTPYGFSDSLTDTFKISGCSSYPIREGLREFYYDFNMDKLVNPRDYLSTSFRTQVVDAFRIDSIIERLNDSLSTYATDDFIFDSSGSSYTRSSGRQKGWYSNLGYNGWDSEISEKYYNSENEGFVKVLRQIQKDNPELEQKCKDMVETYEEMMKLAKYNRKLFNFLISETNFTEKSSEPLRYSGYSIWSPLSIENNVCSKEQAKYILDIVNKQIEVIPKILESKGYSKEEIQNSLRDSYWNDDLRRFYILDKDGNRTSVTLDLTKEIDPSTGKPYFSTEDEQQYCSTVADLVFLNYLEGDEKENRRRKITTSIERYNALKAKSEISESDILKMQELQMKLFGLKYVRKDDREEVKPTEQTLKEFRVNTQPNNFVTNNLVIEKSSEDDLLDVVLSNLNLYMTNHIVNYTIARKADNNNNKTSLNKIGWGVDYSRNFSYYFANNDYYDKENRMINCNSDRVAKILEADELNNHIENQITQLSKFSNVSQDYIKDIKSYYEDKARATGETFKYTIKQDSFSKIGPDFSNYHDSPLKDVLFNTVSMVSSFVPKMVENGEDKMMNLFKKRADYIPFDFKSNTQKRLSDLNSKTKAVAQSELKKLRQAAYKAVNCTLEVEDEDTSLQMRKDFLKNWDYDGVTHKKIYGGGSNSFGGHNRRALFNSRFFKVKNSNMEQPFKDYCEKNNQVPAEHYHATSYGSTAGILGVTGGFKWSKDYIKVAQALGPGVYLGKKGGKSSVYCGEGKDGYHDLSSTGAIGDNANGCYLLTSVIPGSSSDSTICNGFREYEIVVRNNKCLLPHHIVDISCRSLGINVTRDSQGNYLDNNGKITHDRYGTKIDME